MNTPIAKFRKSMNSFFIKLRGWGNVSQKKALDKFEIKYNMGMKVNPRDSLSYFIETIAPYANHILSGDDEYFLHEHIEVEDEYHNLSQQLKVWWPELSELQRNYVKTQFKLLLMLGALAIQNDELLEIINSYRSPDDKLSY